MSVSKPFAVLSILLLLGIAGVALPDAAELENVVFYGDRAEFTEDGAKYVTQPITGSSIGTLTINVSIPDNGTGELLYERSSDGFQSITNRERVTVHTGAESYLLPADQRGDMYRFVFTLPVNSTLHGVGTGNTGISFGGGGGDGALIPQWMVWVLLVVIGVLLLKMVLDRRQKKRDVFREAERASKKNSG